MKNKACRTASRKLPYKRNDSYQGRQDAAWRRPAPAHCLLDDSRISSPSTKKNPHRVAALVIWLNKEDLNAIWINVQPVPRTPSWEYVVFLPRRRSFWWPDARRRAGLPRTVAVASTGREEKKNHFAGGGREHDEGHESTCLQVDMSWPCRHGHRKRRDYCCWQWILRLTPIVIPRNHLFRVALLPSGAFAMASTFGMSRMTGEKTSSRPSTGDYPRRR